MDSGSFFMRADTSKQSPSNCSSFRSAHLREPGNDGEDCEANELDRAMRD